MMSPAAPRSDRVHSRSSPVVVGLICTTLALACFASEGMRAAGCTRPEVPMANNMSHSWAALNARCNSLTGRSSPNQTTSGRTKPPQLQMGGLNRRPPSGSSGMPGGTMWAWPQVAQRGECRLPWRCSTSVLPAQHLHAPPFVPAPDQFLVFAKGAGRGQVFGIETFPQTRERIAKGGDAAFSRNPGTREHHDMLCFSESDDQVLRDGGGMFIHGISIDAETQSIKACAMERVARWCRFLPRMATSQIDAELSILASLSQVRRISCRC